MNNHYLWCCVGLMVLLTSSQSLAVGKQLYADHCANCHSLTLRGSAHGTSLIDSAFKERWGEDGGAKLLAFNQGQMPPGEADKLSVDEHRAIVAYLLQQNGIEGEALPAGGTTESWDGAAAVAAMARSKSGFKNRPVDNYEPVTETLLADVPDSDWLSWRRTRDGQGYSPLNQISRRNVGKLQLVWSLAMHDGSNQTTPLVHNGVMYLTHANNIVQAVEADTGSLIWEYRYEFPAAARALGGPTRNIAIYQDKLFLATYDAAIVAIDARTGRQIWRTPKADYQQAYTHSAGPIIGDGVVLSGINGCELLTRDGCFITGHDPQTGKELWRTSTIALPGDPNNASWGDMPPELRGGGDAWIAGSYDAELNLFFIGTSQAKPWVAASRGMTAEDAALYTNSTLAIHPRTGEIAWFYQHTPGETIDMETGFERILINIGGERHLFTIGKDGILWQLDAATGKFRGLAETQAQNIYKTVNQNTGELQYRDDIVQARIGDSIQACPGIYGGHNWQAAAYSPQVSSLIIPLHQTCSDLTGRQVELAPGGGGYGGDSTTYPMPGVGDQLGRLTAWNVTTMSERWNHTQDAMFLTGVLTTGGDLAFVGDVGRYFKAFDVHSGKQLWQTRLGAPLHGYPISYAVNGKQYVAVPTGMGVFRALTAVISPQYHQPVNGQALYVFALPDE